MSGLDMRKIMENLNTETPKVKLNESLGGTPMANDIMALAAKLEAVQAAAEAEELAENMMDPSEDINRKAAESVEDTEQTLEEMAGRKPWFIQMLDRDPDPADAVDFLFRWKAMVEEFKAAHPRAYQQIEDQEGVSYFVTSYIDINQLKNYVETGKWEEGY